MKYRTMGKLGIQASAFGLGCMRFNGAASGDSVIDEEKAIALIRRAIDGGVTYLDTAYVYLSKTSEIVLGKALKDGYRDRVTIATKMPMEAVHDRASMEALLEEELRKLQTDHIDFYLMHGINKEKWEYFKSIGAREFFNDMKKAGKIRYKCFSFHGPYDEFEAILNDWDWDMVQIQYNFMDIENQAGTKGLELAGSKGIPVVIMEGLLGGRLSKAPANVQALYDAFPVKRSPVEWAFRWLCNHPEVSVVLSGCNEEQQVDDNLRIFDTVEPGIMSADELALMDNVRAAYLSRTKIGCTGCRYCMPCPNGVDIPGIFSVWNNVSLYDVDPKTDWGLRQIREKGKGADNCIGCGACEAACPQHLNIIESLQKAWQELNG
ncbi:MAG: aldo/keto reductase [Clostridiales bacterium]|nr:aldo/keto reductase [Clostridia bacterium]MCR4882823.1 aldo/keto reductase [Clostridiales bacterium]